MSNYYEQVAANRFGHAVFKSLGLPTPVSLQRGDAACDQANRVLIHLPASSTLLTPILELFSKRHPRAKLCAQSMPAERVCTLASELDLEIQQADLGSESSDGPFHAMLFDATTLQSTEELLALHRFFQPAMRKLANSGRIIILGHPPGNASNSEAAAVSQALEGFCRSIAKEVGKRGATANLIQVADGADPLMAPALRFLLSPRSAYVDGQVIRVSASKLRSLPDDAKTPLAGQTALVTGAARGIGAAIARTLASRGAQVIGIDVEPARADLERLATEIHGRTLIADITAADAAEQILAALGAAGQANIVVHNAGITRDKMLSNMPENWWTSTLDVNLGAVLRINQALLDAKAIPENGRIIGVSSMNGIAGQVGQSNYAASKAGTIGWVRRLAEELQDQKITVNAVAPGFIETQMTDAIPLMTREIGRRMNSLSQGGKPIDVAEAIAFFADPESSGINGNILRVCGQCVVGA